MYINCKGNITFLLGWNYLSSSSSGEVYPDGPLIVSLLRHCGRLTDLMQVRDRTPGT